MSTIEKMMLQIFERKKSVIEQVKYRIDLFDDFLASTCLFEGIAPPPSLWSPRLPGLKKEKIIAGRVSRCCPESSNVCSVRPGNIEPIVTAQNEGLPDGLCSEFDAFDGNAGARDRLSVSPQFPANDTQPSTSSGVPELDDANAAPPPHDSGQRRTSGNSPNQRQSVVCIQRSNSIDGTPGLTSGLNAEVDALNRSNGAHDNLSVLTQLPDDNAKCITVGGVPEHAASATSPYDCGNARTLVNSPDQSQSLARFQRSKSRQKALEIRNSKKAVKCCQHDGNVEEERDDTVVAETDICSDRPVQASPVTPGPNLDSARFGLKTLIPKLSPDMLLDLKQLDFDDAEECSLNEISKPLLENKQQDAPLDEQPDSTDMFDKVGCQESSAQMSLLEDHGFSCKEKKSWNDSSQAHMMEYDSLAEENNSGAVQAKLNSSIYQEQYADSYFMGSWPQQKRMKIANTLSALPGLTRKPFQPVYTDHVVDPVQSNIDKIVVDNIDQNREHQIKGPEVSSSDLLAEEISLERRDISAENVFPLAHEQFETPSISSLRKSVISQGCLFQKAEVLANTDIVLDTRGEDTATEKQVMQQVEDGYYPNNKQKDTPSDKRSPTSPNSTERLAKSDYQDKPNISSEISLLKNSGFSCKDKQSCIDSAEVHMKVCDALTKENHIKFGKTKLNSEVSQNQHADSYFTGSWPLHKRMKMAHTLSAAPDLMRKPFQPIHKDPVVDGNESNANQILADEIDRIVHHQITGGLEFSSPKLPPEEVQPSLEKMDISAGTAFALMHEQLRATSLSSLSKSDISQVSLLEKADVPYGTSIIFDEKGEDSIAEEQVIQPAVDGFEPRSTKRLTYTEKSMQQRKSHVRENSSCPVGSPCPKVKVYDQDIPEFERFVIETSDEQSLLAGESIDIDKLELPNAALERASILERLCKSASLHTPLSEVSTTYNFHKKLNLYQSVPNGLLDGLQQESICDVNSAGERIDVDSSYFNLSQSLPIGILDRIEMGRTHNLNSNNDKQFEAIPNCTNDEANSPFIAQSEPECQLYSDSQSVWDSRKPYFSPVGKLWDGNHGILSKSGSSERRVSSIPDLPSISEEDENSEDMVCTFQNGVFSENMTCSLKIEPFKDTTNTINPRVSVQEAQTLDDRCSLASVNKEFSFAGSCKKSKWKHGNQSSNKRSYNCKGKENNLSLGAAGIKRPESVRNGRFSKSKLSEKNSVAGVKEKESRCNNIVSNITSFIPLVQQKQAAAVITGKRDIKVKALEAAEAAKHLAEKKENERKMRKEALKLERAKMEELNLRQLELEKEKKEEQRKRKVAELALKKRQREEEERNEKERKRKCLKGARRQQLEHGEKVRADKEEKELKGKTQDGRAHERNEVKDNSGHYEKMKKEDDKANNIFKEPESEATRVSEIDNRKSSIPECSGAMDNYAVNSKEISNICKASERDGLVSNTFEERSYEISPYKSSDDEEEDDEDDIHNSKHIPSWASKHRVAIAVSSQQGIDPKSIFSPGSFCDIAEVLLPRSLWQRQQ